MCSRQGRSFRDDTLIVWMGDFGRTPRINGAGRDLWGSSCTAVMAGGGMRGGQVYGTSDRLATYPQDDPVSHGDVHATIYHELGIDSQSLMVEDQLGRPVHRHDPGKPIVRLFR